MYQSPVAIVTCGTDDRIDIVDERSVSKLDT